MTYYKNTSNLRHNKRQNNFKQALIHNSDTNLLYSMKFSLVFVLIALFAVITISQARSRAEETAASNYDGTNVNTKNELELTKEQAFVVEAMGRNSVNYTATNIKYAMQISNGTKEAKAIFKSD